jgi:hypothetical protein
MSDLGIAVVLLAAVLVTAGYVVLCDRVRA